MATPQKQNMKPQTPAQPAQAPAQKAPKVQKAQSAPKVQEPEMTLEMFMERYNKHQEAILQDWARLWASEIENAPIFAEQYYKIYNALPKATEAAWKATERVMDTVLQDINKQVADAYKQNKLQS